MFQLANKAFKCKLLKLGEREKQKRIAKEKVTVVLSGCIITIWISNVCADVIMRINRK